MAGVFLLLTFGCASSRSIRSTLQDPVDAVLAVANAESAGPPARLSAIRKIDGYVFETYQVGGATVVLHPYPDAPAVVLETVFASGYHDDPPERGGLADLMYQVLRVHPSDPVMADLENLGARVRSGLDGDLMFFSVAVPFIPGQPDPLERAVALHASRFSRTAPKDIDLMRARARALIHRHRRRDPRAKIDDTLTSNLFGFMSSQARQLAVSRLGSNDVETALDQSYIPSRALFIVAGRFDRGRALAALRKTLGARLLPKEVESSMAPEPPHEPSISLEQTNARAGVAFAWVAPRLTDEDRTAFEGAVLELVEGTDEPLGHGLEGPSLLGIKLTPSARFPSLRVLVEPGTQTSSTAMAESVTDPIAHLVDSPPKGERLASLKTKLQRRRIRALEDFQSRLDRVARFAGIDGGLDALVGEANRIEHLQPEAVSAAARQYLQSERSVRLRLTKREELRGP